MSQREYLVKVSLTTADLTRALEEITSRGVTVYHATEEEDGLTLHFCVQQNGLKTVQKVAEKRGYELKIDRFGTLFLMVKRLRKRPVLVFGVFLLIALTILLPTRIWFVQVEGNEKIPTKQILEQSDRIGIGFGTKRSVIRSEAVKNGLLETIPELQWVGINTKGCVAVITVRERSKEEEPREEKCVCSLIANRDGVITRFTVTGGTCRIQPGQAVKRGEVLVSGYTDVGLCIRAEHSQGEIFAKTMRELEIKTLSEYLLEGETTRVEKKYALLVGKNRINLYKGSGISGTGCDKIYSESYVTLPGGFRLPIALVTETVAYCDVLTNTVDPDAAQRLNTFADAYLPGEMTDGLILSRTETIEEGEGYLVLRGQYACEEMIAKTRSEEIIKPYGNDH